MSSRSWATLGAFLLLAGCASPPAAQDEAAAPGPESTTGLAAVAPTPLHFASGNFESLTTYDATFAPTDMCVPECSGTALQLIDLSDIVPADAPVEMTIKVTSDGSVSAGLVFQDAEPVRIEQQGGGQSGFGGSPDIQISALVVRAAAGTVELRLTHRFASAASGPGAASPVTANVEARTVVRSQLLVGGMPAAIDLEPGQVLNFSNPDLDQVVLFTDAALVRDVDAPFTLEVPDGTRGDVIVMVIGGDTQVLGPNTTMAARRVVAIEGDAKDIGSGTDTTFDITATKPPLLVGIALEPKDPAAGFFSVGDFLGPYSVTITSPGNVDVLDETPQCDAFCQNPLDFFGDGDAVHQTSFLNEYLTAGTYSIVISAEQTNNYQATPYTLQIAE